MTAMGIRAADIKKMMDSGKVIVLLDARSNEKCGEPEQKLPGANGVRVYASRSVFSRSGGISGTGIRVGSQT